MDLIRGAGLFFGGCYLSFVRRRAVCGWRIFPRGCWIGRGNFVVVAGLWDEGFCVRGAIEVFLELFENENVCDYS